MSFRTHIITLLSLAVLCSTVSAQNVKYVTDQLQAPIRASANDNSRIIKMLTSGEKIKILSESKQFYEIQYGDNNAHGWIHKNFVMNDPAAREFVEMAKQEYAPLQESIASLTAQNNDKDQLILSLQENQKKLEQALLVQTNRVTHLEQINKNVIDIDNDNQLLTQVNMQQELELKQLKSENFTLKENKRSDEWLKGASILFAGIVLGTSILPRLLRYRNQKRNWSRY
ncbi:TIGR04211 family SH3 domain-containing protein [Wohlfahrtiimonas larvae]|uniref:SH3b domain-containing protein n=3 Tax=Wohlfahrtiimonas larvae TaxID=1157986 RepID=A0ABP9MFZ9_9GAMM